MLVALKSTYTDGVTRFLPLESHAVFYYLVYDYLKYHELVGTE